MPAKLSKYSLSGRNYPRQVRKYRVIRKINKNAAFTAIVVLQAFLASHFTRKDWTS
jgi:hypothetical protein